MDEDKKILVEFYIREGEYSPVCRFEFPHQSFIYSILESTPVNEQKKYKFYFFNNILVSNNYSKDVLKFLKKGAKKAGFEIEFVEKKR
ncbi:MAG: hypothetical protein DRO92_03120 [Candidatus Altiarchaeales archaeon]|mgnify:CR=1 FL=1|nr:MAG: hypothetical protein DRO92_03120 [Candidatus Altiarchaeales archaeon]